MRHLHMGFMINLFPVYQFKSAIHVFHQGSAALNPITAVHVQHLIDRLDLRSVYVSTDHSRIALPVAHLGEIFFKFEYEAHRTFNVVFEELAHAPIVHAQQLPGVIENVVDPQS